MPTTVNLPISPHISPHLPTSPQVRVPTTVNLILELRPAPPPEAPPQLALGCLVLHSHAAAGRKLQMTSEDVVAKAGLLN